MNLILTLSAVALTAALSLTSCHAQKPQEAAVNADMTGQPLVIGGRPGANMPAPKARIYRMNGPYAQNVPIQLNAARTEIVSFPAPSDLTSYSTPIPLADGWYLDRRGVGENTAFTRYTYAEYSALPTAPTTTELLNSIIPEARITTIRTLDMTTREAVNDTAALNRRIRAGRL